MSNIEEVDLNLQHLNAVNNTSPLFFDITTVENRGEEEAQYHQNEDFDHIDKDVGGY